jgi:hypothetical protein
MNRRRVGLLVAVLVIGVGLPVAAHYEHQSTVDGTVLLPNGRPAAGAEVFCPATGEQGFVLCKGHTNSSGKFHLRGQLFPRGLLGSVLAVQPGYACGWAPAGPGQTVTVRLGANPVTLAGTVVRAAGPPVAPEPGPPPSSRAGLTRLSPPAAGAENSLASPGPGQPAPAGASPPRVAKPAAGVEISLDAAEAGKPAPAGASPARVTGTPGGAENSLASAEAGKPAPAGAGPARVAAPLAGAQNTLASPEAGKPAPAGAGPAPVAAPPAGAQNSLASPAPGKPAPAGASPAPITAPPVSAANALTAPEAGKPGAAGAGPAGGIRVCVCQLVMPGQSAEQWWGASACADNPFETGLGAGGSFSLPGLPREAAVLLVVKGPGLATQSLFVEAARTDLRLTMQPEATLEGRVTHEGRPVAGVTVTAYGAGGGRAVTGADGAYRLTGLSAGWITVQVAQAPPGLVAVSNTVVPLATGEHRKGVDLALTPGATLSGRVTETGSGRPLPGLYVQVSWPGVVHRVGYDVVRTAADGTYEAHMAAGTAVVSVETGDPRSDWRDWAADPEARPVSAKRGQTLTGLDFKLSPPAQLQGRVVRADGKPAAGVAVGCLGIGGISEITTDQHGHFSVRMPDPRHLPWQDCAIVAHDDHAGLVGVAFPTGLTDQLVITLHRGAYLVGHVQDEQGQPVPGIRPWVTLYTPRGLPGPRGMPMGPPATPHEISWRVEPTDAHGNLRVGPLPPGMVVEARLDSLQNLVLGGGRGYFVYPGLEQVVKARMTGQSEAPGLQEGQTVHMPTIRLKAHGTEVRAQVVDSSGKPVAGAAAAAGVVLPVGQMIFTPPVTDAQGNVTLRAPATLRGTWLVAEDAAQTRCAARQITGSESQPIRLVLQALGTLTGRVVDTQGHPVQGAQVGAQGGPSQCAVLRGMYNSGSPLYTGADGKFTCESLPPGYSYTVYVSLTNQNQVGNITGYLIGQGEPRTVKPGQTVKVGDIVIKPYKR